MTLTSLFGLCAVLACVAAQGGFADYDYQDNFPQGAPQPAIRQPLRPPTKPLKPLRPKAAPAPTTYAPPVAILKQINRHNDDGSYTYGYEAADGSYKIETKLVTGEVMGKYGYVDDSGKLRTVEYGANRYGFQPSGEGITVPPPTLVDETLRRGPNGESIEEVDDGSYYEQEQAPQRVPQNIQPRQQQSQQQRPQHIQPRPQQVQQRTQHIQPRPQHIQPRPQQIQPRPQNFQPRPQFEEEYVAPSIRQKSPSIGPAPPRAVIPGAAPVHESAPRSDSVFRSTVGDTYQQNSPADYQQNRRNLVRERNDQAPRVLDGLAKQYAIPRGSGGAALHDISFGSYSSQTNF